MAASALRGLYDRCDCSRRKLANTTHCETCTAYHARRVVSMAVHTSFGTYVIRGGYEALVVTDRGGFGNSRR